tara:strand:+ start:140 stop:514 length:375 start_codon:yes stop_codon:yes gene_type:complete
MEMSKIITGERSGLRELITLMVMPMLSTLSVFQRRRTQMLTREKLILGSTIMISLVSVNLSRPLRDLLVTSLLTNLLPLREVEIWFSKTIKLTLRPPVTTIDSLSHQRRTLTTHEELMWINKYI